MLSVAILVVSHASGSASEAPYPGLPDDDGPWVGVAQGGITEAGKARQWASVPMQAVAVNNYTRYEYPYPPDDPYGRTSDLVYQPSLFFVPPPGSEFPYGMSPKFKVRTVAFGAIPVEATLQLIQRRSADNLPIPIEGHSSQTTYGVSTEQQRQVYNDTQVEDVVTLRVTRLLVDGVDLNLGNRCQTAKPGALSLLGKGWRQGIDQVDQARPWETGNYAPGSGGLLVGKVDVPAFAGCLTGGGEDVSRLLTSAVSGPDNAVKVNVTGTYCNRPVPPATSGTGPPQTGETTPEAAGCPADKVPPVIPIP